MAQGRKQQSFARFTLILALSLLLLSSGCKKSGSEDSDSTPPTVGSTPGSGLVYSGCGIVQDQQNIGTSSDSAFEVSIFDILQPDLLIVQRSGATGPELVQLLGVTSDGVSSGRRELGLNFLRDNLRRARAYFIPAGPCPVTVAGGGLATLGQIFLNTGENIAELMLAKGSVVAQDNGCQAASVVGCYAAIPVEEEISTQTISWFLWKPVSESDGRLAILVDPFQVDVRVNGERLVDTGPSNQRGTTARASRPGCAYGANARVEFFDRLERRILVANGARSITIPNGCNRVETRY